VIANPLRNNNQVHDRALHQIRHNSELLEPSMVSTTEAFVGSRHGGEGIKLEEQILVTKSGPEALSTFPMDL